MAEQQVVKVDAPVITVRSGDRVSNVPSWPMPLVGVRDRTVELETDAGDALVLVPKRKIRGNHVVFFLCALIPGLFGVGVSMYQFYLEVTGFGLVIWGVVLILLVGLLGFIFLSWLSAGTWIRFDRRAGLISLSRRPFGFLRKPRVYQTGPLAEIVCMQLIYNGFHSERREVGVEDRKTYQIVQYYAYQMNLVLERDGQCRMNLAHHSDWEWMRREGGRLAEYLQVPLVDQLFHD
jgi:hypothetical protein